MINLSPKKIKCKCGKIVLNKMCEDCTQQLVDSQKSQLCECGKYSRYGYKDSKATHCDICKLEDMVNLISQKCFCGNKYPSYGFKTRTHCLDCKEDGMKSLSGTDCKSGVCEQVGSKKYDYYCTHCFSNLFPDDPRTQLIRKKSKEIKVVSYISQKIKGFIHDRPLYVDLKGGCCNSRRRIDLRRLIGNTMLCIEIDEHQHKYYNKQDELDRYDNLFMDFSGKYIFIRYNPDKYKVKSGNNFKNKNPTFQTRMNTLEAEIKYQIANIINEENTELITISKLFYDQRV